MGEMLQRWREGKSILTGAIEEGFMDRMPFAFSLNNREDFGI